MIEISIFCGSRKLIPDTMVGKNTKVPKPKIAIFHHLPLPDHHDGHWAVPPASSSSSLSSSPPKALGLISCAAKSVENLSSPINLINLLQPTNHIVLDWTFGGRYFCGLVKKFGVQNYYCIWTVFYVCNIKYLCSCEFFGNKLQNNFDCKCQLANIFHTEFFR